MRDRSHFRTPHSAVAEAGWLTSLGFWICLLAATAAYAAATLSVRYVENRQLQDRFAQGQTELQHLASQVDRYERYCKQLALSHDGIEPLNAARSMSVGEDLQFHLDGTSPAEHPELASAGVPAVVRIVSQSSTLRRVLIGSAMALVLLAFTRLIGPPQGRSPQHQDVSGLRKQSRLRPSGMRGRYHASTRTVVK